MANLTFIIPSVLNTGGGEKKIQVDANTLGEAFEKISKEMGDDFARRVLNDDGTPRSLINIYINGKNAKFSGGINAVLNDNDEIYILPAVAGGSNDTSESSTSSNKELSSKQLDRYSRQVMLEQIGYNGQLKLRDAVICVVGVGGLGNPITTRLVAMGVGTIRIVDRDVIELSNLHRQTMFDEDDVGKIKVEAASKHLQKLNSEVTIQAFPISVNDYTALEVVDGCDVVIDALDSVNARYSLNKACVSKGIPFVTGGAVGVSGQAFTVLPKENTACYHCMFPELDEDSLPTCSIEGVNPPILSIIGAIEVSEAVKIILGKKPNLSDKILHVDLDSLEFSSTRTFRAQECPVCGVNKKTDVPVHGVNDASSVEKEMIIEELCGRNRGKRTFSITPHTIFDIDVDAIAKIGKEKGFIVDDQGILGLSLRSNSFSASFMKKGSAVIVGAADEKEAVKLYHQLLGKKDEISVSQ